MRQPAAASASGAVAEDTVNTLVASTKAMPSDRQAGTGRPEASFAVVEAFAFISPFHRDRRSPTGRRRRSAGRPCCSPRTAPGSAIEVARDRTDDVEVDERWRRGRVDIDGDRDERAFGRIESGRGVDAEDVQSTG